MQQHAGRVFHSPSPNNINDKCMRLMSASTVYISISYMFSVYCVHCAYVCSLHADTLYEDVRQRWFSAMMNVEGNRGHHASIAPDSNSLICLQLLLIELNSSIACAHLLVRILNRIIVSKAEKRRQTWIETIEWKVTIHSSHKVRWFLGCLPSIGWRQHVRNDDAKILSVLFVFDRHPVSSPSAFGGGIQIVSRTCADGILDWYVDFTSKNHHPFRHDTVGCDYGSI